MAVQLAWSTKTELASLAANTNNELLRHLSLGIDVNVCWQDTPENVRKAVVSRILGQPYLKTETFTAWIESRSDSVHNYDWYIRQCLAIREVAISRLNLNEPSEIDSTPRPGEDHVWNIKRVTANAGVGRKLEAFCASFYEFLCLIVEFVAIISTGGNDSGRELWYTLRRNRVQVPVVWVILKAWKLCWWVKNAWIRLLLLSMDSKYRNFHDWTIYGACRTLSDGVLTITDPRGNRTAFISKSTSGVELIIYDGLHSSLPRKPQAHQIASYDHSMHLNRLVDIKIKPLHTSEYRDYHFDTDKPELKYPCFSTTQLATDNLATYYDHSGRITHGECIKNNVRFNFTYTYKAHPQNSTQVIKATYTSSETNDPVLYSVYWCRESETGSKDVQTWVPTSRVRKFTQSNSQTVQEILWSYEHKRDPIITSTTFSQLYQTIVEFKTLDGFLDEFGFLVKPMLTSFSDEDVLFCHSKAAILQSSSSSLQTLTSNIMYAKSARNTTWSRFWLSLSFWRKKTFVARDVLSTSILRSAPWKNWVTRTDSNAVTTCLLDEFILRQEPLLESYWRYRDAGSFAEAKLYLTDHLEEIVDTIDIIDEYSQCTNLAIKFSDLLVMGLSKDSNFVVSNPEGSYVDTDSRVAVIFTDTGCCPDAPGGVSNCRRDLVDGHKTVRNYALTESANEYGIPRFQVEKSLQMVKNLPLWGLDGKSPSHGLFDNLLQMQLETRIRRTRVQEDIMETFIPLLKSIVRGARTIKLSQSDLLHYTTAFLNLNKYFDENDYLKTWRSKAVRKAWREAWLCEYDDPNIANSNNIFEIERPTASDFEEVLELYISYFFIFSVRVPEEVPRVFQSTHHGISSLYGMILKIRRGTTWGIWDHAIMWRESCLNISPAQCILPIAVQSMLLGAMKLAANLAYHHADIILPCTAIYNPSWETEIGTDEGQRSSPNLFRRKIDPITNGISNMDTFKSVEVIQPADPTVIMLSNVQFIKDVKNAVYAADVMTNDFGFKNYNLVVYGAQDRQPSYAIETAELISTLGIGKTVKLGGFGSPKEVLKDAWLFMDSSLSEGLPLAIGEAALSGIPIVATEVGATAQVLTDVDDPSILYGEVVPPNDPVALARAQISLLAMLGPWSRFTKDKTAPPPLPSTFTADDVEWITKRMHNKADDRRALGLKLRHVVQQKFNGQRYLREHEQMYWIQKHIADHRATQHLADISSTHPKFGQPFGRKLIEAPDDQSLWLEKRWQDFSTVGLPQKVDGSSEASSQGGSFTRKAWCPESGQEEFVGT